MADKEKNSKTTDIKESRAGVVGDGTNVDGGIHMEEGDNTNASGRDIAVSKDKGVAAIIKDSKVFINKDKEPAHVSPGFILLSVCVVALVSIFLIVILFTYFHVESEKLTFTQKMIAIVTASAICIAFIRTLLKPLENRTVIRIIAFIVLIPLCSMISSLASAFILLDIPPDEFVSRIILPPKRINRFGMSFVYIPPGTFMMGSPENEAGRYNRERLHKVTLTKGFYMQTTEVTQGQWKAVMGENPSRFQECGNDCPVENVSWKDVQKFIEKLNRGNDGTYRLPTEAEWEYACRAGTFTRYYTGDSEANLDRVGWYKQNSGGMTHSVGWKAANAFGLYDMHGNVWEWCQDRYGNYPSDVVTDPAGRDTGPYRVFRGGSWKHSAQYCRSARRYWNLPIIQRDYLGFRVVLFLGQQD